MIWRVLLVSVALVALPSCDNDRLSKLEKDNEALRHQVSALEQKAGSLEYQSKCAKDAREWFNREWHADKDTMLLTYQNHYSSRLNQCFATVSWNYNIGPQAFMKTTLIYNVYENSQLAEYAEQYMYSNGKGETTVNRCEVNGTKCSSMNEFGNGIKQYVFE